MKPRNDIERKAVEAHGKLPPITEKQKRWAYEHCFKKEAISHSKKSDKYICLECGSEFTLDYDRSLLSVVILGDEVYCPYCGQKLEVKISPRRKNTIREIQTFQMVTTQYDFQITRTFYAFKFTRPHSPAQFEIQEVSQLYQMPGRKTIAIALPRVACFAYSDLYQFDKEMSIKRDSDFYSLCATSIYPWQKVLPIIKRNGYSHELKKFNPSETFRRLMYIPEFETIAKCKRFDMWGELNESELRHLWQQIKMVIRHNYKPYDFGIWKDTIRMADELGLDIHSPKYVMPEDLKSVHDMLSNRIRRKELAIRKKKERERIAKNKEYEKLFKKYNAALLDIVLTSGDITILPLKNYEDYVQEGDAMHHCVETYWKRKESFIMSARSGGDRLATIELDRKDFHVVQCRAKCNEKPDRYDEIVGIINDNVNTFIQAQKSNNKISKS